VFTAARTDLERENYCGSESPSRTAMPDGAHRWIIYLFSLSSRHACQMELSECFVMRQWRTQHSNFC